MINMKQNLLKKWKIKRLCVNAIEPEKHTNKEKPIYKYLFFMLYISLIFPLGDLT